MIRAFALALALAAAAFPAAAADAPERYTLTVTPQQVDIIGRALRHSPDAYERVQDLIEQLTGQVVAQQKTTEEAKPAGQAGEKAE